MSKVLLITGATGKQGGATVNALLNSPQSKDFTILAVTRNPDSPSAKKLAEKGIKLVKGDLDDVPAIFAAAKEVSKDPIWGVFSIQTPLGSRGAKSEETRGKALVDEAVKGGVKMFVYTSVERGGDEKSFDNPTPIPHFISKYNIEKHLLEKAKEAKMDWCILRPVAFMDVRGNFCLMIVLDVELSPNNRTELPAWLHGQSLLHHVESCGQRETPPTHCVQRHRILRCPGVYPS